MQRPYSILRSIIKQIMIDVPHVSSFASITMSSPGGGIDHLRKGMSAGHDFTLGMNSYLV